MLMVITQSEERPRSFLWAATAAALRVGSALFTLGWHLFAVAAQINNLLLSSDAATTIVK